MIRWEKGHGIGAAYAERLSDVSREAGMPLPPEAFQQPPPSPHARDLEASAARIEQAGQHVLRLLERVAKMAEDVGGQLDEQTKLLAELRAVAAELGTLRAPESERRAGGASG